MEVVGYLAGLGSLIGFLPQTIKTIRSRHTKDLSFSTFTLLGSSALLWVIYGVGEGKLVIWLPNAIVTMCALSIVLIKLRNHGQ